jgi:hypothetical protein
MLPYHRDGGAIFIEIASREAEPIAKSVVLEVVGIVENLTRRNPAFVPNPTRVLLPNQFLPFRFDYNDFIWRNQPIDFADSTISPLSLEKNVRYEIGPSQSAEAARLPERWVTVTFLQIR